MVLEDAPAVEFSKVHGCRRSRAVPCGRSVRAPWRPSLSQTYASLPVCFHLPCSWAGRPLGEGHVQVTAVTVIPSVGWHWSLLGGSPRGFPHSECGTSWRGFSLPQGWDFPLLNPKFSCLAVCPPSPTGWLLPCPFCLQGIRSLLQDLTEPDVRLEMQNFGFTTVLCQFWCPYLRSLAGVGRRLQTTAQKTQDAQDDFIKLFDLFDAHWGWTGI